MVLMLSSCSNLHNGISSPTAGASQSQISLIQEEQTPPTTAVTSTAPLVEQQSPYEEIEAVLRANPPCSGNDDIRRDAILAFDKTLRNNTANFDPAVSEFYENMMRHMEEDFNEPVLSGMRIWLMYNHGFIVKTPSATFAFDLVHGYPQWDYRIPDSILEQIQVLFISHRHGDHRNLELIKTVKDFGGEVVMPIEDKPGDFGTIYLSPDQELTIAGLQVKAYDGLHELIPLRIYQVVTPEGLTIMHTGDNQTSETLPSGVKVDILLLNAWVNESGFDTPVAGMRNSIDKLGPRLTIPGHIQELSHHYDPNDIRGRLAYIRVIAVDAVPLPGEVSFQVWGEHCDFPPH
jgi:L-ascorbate metabolism protein UlaG (beta-lactamase superfamily)